MRPSPWLRRHCCGLLCCAGAWQLWQCGGRLVLLLGPQYSHGHSATAALGCAGSVQSGNTLGYSKARSLTVLTVDQTQCTCSFITRICGVTIRVQCTPLCWTAMPTLCWLKWQTVRFAETVTLQSVNGYTVDIAGERGLDPVSKGI